MDGEYFSVDGAPAIVSGLVAMKVVGDYWVPVTPSSVRAEGTTRAVSDQYWSWRRVTPRIRIT